MLSHTADGLQVNNFNRKFNYGSSFGPNLLEGLTIGGSTYEYKYDASGNQTKENTDRYYEWNYADKLAFFKRQASDGNPSVRVHYFYDASGQRIKKAVNKPGGIQEITVYIDGVFEHSYVRINNNVDNSRNYNTLHVLDSSSRIATLRVGNDSQDSTPALKFYVEDHLGNSSVAVQSNGDRINLEEYYPFGETSYGSFAKKRYRYCGKEKDSESGLYYYGQRYYAPWLCRFLSVDPIAEDYPFYSSYNYAGNKPESKVDIDGLQEQGADTGPSGGSNKGKDVVGFESGVGTPESPIVGPTFEITGMHSYAEGSSKMEATQFINPLDGMSFAKPEEKTYHQGSASNPSGWYSAKSYSSLVHKDGYNVGMQEENASNRFSLAASELDHSSSMFSDGRHLAQGFEEKYASTYLAGLNSGMSQFHFNRTGTAYSNSIDFDVLSLGGGKSLASVFRASANKLSSGSAVQTTKYVFGLKTIVPKIADDIGGVHLMKDPNWQKSFINTIDDPSSEIHFILDGIDSTPMEMILKPNRSGINWELQTLYNNPKAFERTIFHYGGKTLNSADIFKIKP